jgi:hypothetical protein
MKVMGARQILEVYKGKILIACAQSYAMSGGIPVWN